MSANVSIEWAAVTDIDLLRLRLAVDTELRNRGLAHSVGIAGERAAVEHYRKAASLPKLQHAPTGTKNVDALSREGDRYSIKTICNGKKTGTVYPDTVCPEKQLFEYLLVVHLSNDWLLKSIHQFTWDQFLAVRAWDKRMNAWYVGISARTLAIGSLIFDGHRQLRT